MKKYKLLFFAIIISLGSISSYGNIYSKTSFKNSPPKESFFEYSLDFYNQIEDTSLNFDAFQTALRGFMKLQNDDEINNSKYLTIIDMSLSSNKDRFFIINLESKKLVKKSKVAHGRNTGNEFAKLFSNTISSYQTSLGFYKTAETYSGKHGLSLRLDGLESSNSNARKRAIVIHSADYVSNEFISKNGRLGRSLGCPALPKKGYSQIINQIKEGSLLFIYYPQRKYFEKSGIAKSNVNEILGNQSDISSAR